MDLPRSDEGAGPSSAASGRASSAGPSRQRSYAPEFMTVGSGSTSASAAALVASLDHDSGYGGSLINGHDRNQWLSGTTDDPFLPESGFGQRDPEVERRHMASHVHQLYYNQNRATLGRQITSTIEILQSLQQINSTWPAQYPTVAEPPQTQAESRPTLSHTRSTAGPSNPSLHQDPPLRPQALRRAATSHNSHDDSISTSPSAAEEEPERLLTAQSAHNFSVLKLNMNVQGLTQAQIAHSMKKESIASLLDGKINQSIHHLLLLRDRIEDISSKVLVTGDLNAGKSTFCNALLRRKILPEDQQPCTSIFCEVLDAKENAGFEEAHAIRKNVTYDRNDESTYDVYQLIDLDKVVSDNERYTSCKIYVRDARKIDESLLNNGVVDIALIDAPGLNSDSLQTTAVFARQEEIDVVVFVVSAANHFTQSAKEFIWNAAHEKAYIFIVVNGFDNIADQEKCKRKILEQIYTLSPRTFKESSELVHFVSSNAIPVSRLVSSGSGGGGGGGGGGDDGDDDNRNVSGIGDSDKDKQKTGASKHKSPLEHIEDDGEEDDGANGKHGSPGLPPVDKGKGKAKEEEKLNDFDDLESSLRRFVLEKRARSKLAPAKTYLLNLLTDLHLLAEVNRDLCSSELARVKKELEQIEPAFFESQMARSKVDDEVKNMIEESREEIYQNTRTIVNNSISQVSQQDLGVPYDGLFSAFQFAEDLKSAMLQQVSNAVILCEQQAKAKSISGVNAIKSMGLLHLGNDNSLFKELTFNSDRMFTSRKNALARDVDLDIHIADFFDFSGLWHQQEKVAGTGMALTVASLVGGRLLGGGGLSWMDGTLGALRVMGPQNVRRMIVPSILLAALLASTYLLHNVPHILPARLSRRIAAELAALDYTHQNAARISKSVAGVLRHPSELLLSGLVESERELGYRRDDQRKLQQESEVAQKYFSNLVRRAAGGRARVEDVDLDGGSVPGIPAGYEPVFDGRAG